MSTTHPTANYPRDDVFEYLESWIHTLDFRMHVYNRLMAGSMSGIILIVVTIGLNLESVSKFGWFEKTVLCISLFLLLMSLGNILNCWMFVRRSQLHLHDFKRTLILNQVSHVPADEVRDLDQKVRQERERVDEFYRYSYGSFVLAILLGVIAFFVILWRF